MNRLQLLQCTGLLMLINLLAGCIQTNSVAQPTISPDWENQQILQRNRLPARATFIPYPDEATARKCNPAV